MGHLRGVDHVLVLGVLAVVAVAAVVFSPSGRTTLNEVRRHGLMFRHARVLGHMMIAVALLAVVAAALGAR